MSPLIALMKDQIDFLTRHGHRRRAAGLVARRGEVQSVAAECAPARSSCSTLRPSASTTNGSSPALAGPDLPFRDGRGALHLRVGPQLPAGLPEAGGYARAAGGGARPGADRHRHARRRRATSARRSRFRAGAPSSQASTAPTSSCATTPVRADERDALLLERLAIAQPGSAIVYVTLQKTAERVAERAAASRPARPRAYHAGMEAEERDGGAGALDGVRPRASSWPPSPSAWASTRRTSATSTTTTCPRAWRATARRSGAPAATASPPIVEMLACPDDVPTLENFAYGDTPRRARCALWWTSCYAGDEFALELYDLSGRHDLRPLVLRTALTYLELQGVLRQGTPYYAGYEIRPLLPMKAILAEYPGEPSAFLSDIFANAKFGRTWYTLDPDRAAETLEQPRRRIVRALEVLEERGHVEIRASDVRNRYTLLRSDADAAALAAELSRRFLHREQQELSRLQQVLSLVTYDGCQTNYLVAHFGEVRASPCGHCTHCITGRAQALPAAASLSAAPGRAGCTRATVATCRAARRPLKSALDGALPMRPDQPGAYPRPPLTTFTFWRPGGLSICGCDGVGFGTIVGDRCIHELFSLLLMANLYVEEFTDIELPIAVSSNRLNLDVYCMVLVVLNSQTCGTSVANGSATESLASQLCYDKVLTDFSSATAIMFGRHGSTIVPSIYPGSVPVLLLHCAMCFRTALLRRSAVRAYVINTD